jgi:hypothetical protein
MHCHTLTSSGRYNNYIRHDRMRSSASVQGSLDRALLQALMPMDVKRRTVSVGRCSAVVLLFSR